MGLTADVIIAGAGPAGSRAARDLATEGFEVVVLEDHSQVGRPCHCSGLVTPRTLELAGAGGELVLNSIRGATVYLPEGQSLRFTGRRIQAYVIDRIELDRLLAEQAQAAGAKILTSTRLLQFTVTGSAAAGRGRVEVLARGPQGNTRLTAQLLIGADGAFSQVATQLAGVRPAGIVRGIGAEASYQANGLSDHVEVFLDAHSTPGWFAWTIPMRPGTSRVGAGSANGMRALESFKRVKSRFPATFGTAEITSITAGAIPLWKPGPITAERVMLVGDAARQVKPTSGGGILTALLSAQTAAAAAAGLLRKGDLAAPAMRLYPARLNNQIGGELRRQHDMRRVFDRLDETQLAAILRAVASPGIKRGLEEIADVDFPSRIVRRLIFRRPDMLLRAAGMPRFPLAWLLPRRSAALSLKDLRGRGDPVQYQDAIKMVQFVEDGPSFKP